ncbi:MAG: hypothetical protein MUD09_10160 [Desulfobacterales bacterium]|jgi:hypothetical protein|nr:hypothetical protein [Desulfobacterales bacterium]
MMRRKFFLIVMALLTLYVIINIIMIRKGDITRVNNQIMLTERRLQEKMSEKIQLAQEKKHMETTLLSIPQTILEGFEDPDRQFVDFMDYVNGSNLKKMQGEIFISQMQTYKDDPVPLQESRFEFKFTMEKTRQLEEFLDYLLVKGKYPVNVEQFEIKRIPQQYPLVTLQVALLLPAKIDLPQFTQQKPNPSLKKEAS